MPAPNDELIYDWNALGARAPARDVAVLDDTLRDGLQNASVRKPELGERAALLRKLAALGVEAVNLGLPGASELALAECSELLALIAQEKLPLIAACAGRTLPRDMEAIVELGQRAGVALEAHAFVGSSPIRMAAEGWSLAELEQRTKSALEILRRAGLDATFVTEDTTRSHPAALERLFAVAIDHGARRLCLCDTVGHATPEGAQRLVEFARGVAERAGVALRIDWHGHNDRGLALAVALGAVAAGVDRVHATALGIGERVGNTPLELLLVNLRLLGRWSHPLGELMAYCRAVSRAVNWPIPKNYPLVGENAFRTATGVHAAAITKARARFPELSDRVYSGVPSSWLGREQEICVGYMSGASNVLAWLEAQALPAPRELVDYIVHRAKRADHILSDSELLELVSAFHAREGLNR